MKYLLLISSVFLMNTSFASFNDEITERPESSKNQKLNPKSDDEFKKEKKCLEDKLRMKVKSNVELKVLRIVALSWYEKIFSTDSFRIYLSSKIVSLNKTSVIEDKFKCEVTVNTFVGSDLFSNCEYDNEIEYDTYDILEKEFAFMSVPTGCLNIKWAKKGVAESLLKSKTN